MHAFADALAWLLAIFALLGAKFYGFVWMDPAIGVAGAPLVARGSLGLLRTTGGVLLDRTGPQVECCKSWLLRGAGLVRVAVEVHRCN